MFVVVVPSFSCVDLCCVALSSSDANHRGRAAFVTPARMIQIQQRRGFKHNINPEVESGLVQSHVCDPEDLDSDFHLSGSLVLPPNHSDTKEDV